MIDTQHSALVEAMSPRYVPDEGTRIEVIPRRDFSLVIQSAMNNDEFGPIGHSGFMTDKVYDYKAIDMFSIHTVSPSMRDKWLEHKEAQRANAPSAERIREIDMRHADRFLRRSARNVLKKVGIEPPEFLQTNWRVYNRIQERREKSRVRFLQSGDLITFRDKDQSIWYVAEDSENRFRHNT